MQRIDAEALMDEAVRAAGGQRVSELVGVNPPFDNADYVFKKDNIVAEMKNLEKDFLSDPAVGNKMHELYNRWVAEGKDVPIILGSGILRTDQIPIECRRELVDIFKDKLENAALQKANRQIRETKTNLNHPDALGLLLISNEGNFAFDPAMLAHVLLHSLGSKFSSIDHVIFLSANLRVQTASSGAGPLFAGIRLPNRRQPTPEFLTKLGSCWLQAMSKATEEKFPPFTLSELSPEEIDQLRFRAP